MKVVFCTNLEMVFFDLESELDQQNKEWQREVITDARKQACKLLPEGCEEECSSRFAEWNGGRFSYQAKMIYDTLGLIAYAGLDIDIAAKIEDAYSSSIDAAILEVNRQAIEYQEGK